MKKAIGYVRISPKGRESEKRSASIETQKASIERWCQLHNCELAAVYGEKKAVSGRNGKRPALEEAVKHCEQGGYILVAYSLSRMCRNVKHACKIAERLHKAGSDFVFVVDNIDSSTASGKLIFHVLAAIAEFESEVASERTRDVMAHKIENGAKVGAAPYGWQWKGVEGRKKLVESPAEQPVLAEILGMRRGLMGLRTIAAELNRRGTKPRRGAEWSG